MMEEECGKLEGPGRAKIEVKPFDTLLMHFAEEQKGQCHRPRIARGFGL